MREIKFRAWDIKNEIMTPAPMSKVYRNKYSLFGDIYLLEKEAFEDTVRVELMQYTGLKDMNGVEIYENDIVRIRGAGTVYMRTIVFEQGTFHFGYLPDGMCDYREMEVVGNTFEGSYLLEGEDE